MGSIQKKGKRGLVADINVTPLVDVMLVLLIIFMVTAPMMTQGVDVNLPATTAKPLRQDENPVIISIDQQGGISLGKIKADGKLLQQELQKLSKTDQDRTILLKADKNVPYGIVAQVMAEVKDAGFNKLGMVTIPVENKR
ncbi:MAG: protein TolR [Proteobacteria bacterium]|nr:protein TolR [Pseudomonadota bacterium]MBU4298260.1 protein TolR [Pseudomonadota bacterium]MCG2747528.1 protein TolR [Desulfobulbaceae bacterium]